jgi:hypothetical protein
MNANLQAYLDALNSGEYQQCDQYLKHGNCFCAIGVLCDVYHKKTGLGEWKSDPTYDAFGFVFVTKGGIRSFRYVTRDVIKWVDIPILLIEKIYKWNDQENWTFPQIAKEIRRYV